jgi:hypothetical protein
LAASIARTKIKRHSNAHHPFTSALPTEA